MANSVRRRSSKKGSKKAASKRSHKSSPPKSKASAKKGKSKRKKKRTFKVKAHSGGMVGGAPKPAATVNINVNLKEGILLSMEEVLLLGLSDTNKNYGIPLNTYAILEQGKTSAGIKIGEYIITLGDLLPPPLDPAAPLPPGTLPPPPLPQFSTSSKGKTPRIQAIARITSVVSEAKPSENISITHTLEGLQVEEN